MTFIVCPQCEGKGVHDPAAFQNGFSKEELDSDPEFRDNYFAGDYDVPCSKCKGLRVYDPEAELARERETLIENDSRCSKCGSQATISCASSFQEYPGAKSWLEHTYYCSEHGSPRN